MKMQAEGIEKREECTTTEPTPTSPSITETKTITQTLRQSKTFGQNLRYLRKEAGLTTKTFAEIVGVTSSYIGLIERGERNPGYDLALKISKFFEVNVADMAGPLGVESKRAKARDAVEHKRNMIYKMSQSFGDESQLEFILSFMRVYKKFGGGGLDEGV